MNPNNQNPQNQELPTQPVPNTPPTPLEQPPLNTQPAPLDQSQLNQQQPPNPHPTPVEQPPFLNAQSLLNTQPPQPVIGGQNIGQPIYPQTNTVQQGGVAGIPPKQSRFSKKMIIKLLVSVVAFIVAFLGVNYGLKAGGGPKKYSSKDLTTSSQTNFSFTYPKSFVYLKKIYKK